MKTFSLENLPNADEAAAIINPVIADLAGRGLGTAGACLAVMGYVASLLATVRPDFIDEALDSLDFFRAEDSPKFKDIPFISLDEILTALINSPKQPEDEKPE